MILRLCVKPFAVLLLLLLATLCPAAPAPFALLPAARAPRTAEASRTIRHAKALAAPTGRAAAALPRAAFVILPAGRLCALSWTNDPATVALAAANSTNLLQRSFDLRAWSNVLALPITVSNAVDSVNRTNLQAFWRINVQWRSR